VISDPSAGISVIQDFDTAFRHCVVYTPPHREAICIEPYTATPDALRLETLGIDAGLRRLAPGGSFHVEIEIACERADGT
jgi:aldose 1-epimerase